MEVNVKDVLSLRNKTGLPLIECKQALIKAEGNVEKAANILIKKLKNNSKFRF